MTNSKNSKKAFLMSAMSLLLCCAMLIGATYAWFTDSASTGVNKIVAGNLDIELKHQNPSMDDYETVDTTTKLFTDANGNDILWEPGVVAYENLVVSNEGSLALQYRLSMNIVDFNTVDGKSLKDVLKVAVVDGAFTGDRTEAAALTYTGTLADFEKTGTILAGADADTYAIVVYWEPSASDNDYNLNNGKQSSDGEPLFVDFGITVVATQYTYETDAIDDQYDADASYDAALVTKIANPTVTYEGADYELETAYAFTALDTVDQAKASAYAEWNADFVVTFDADVDAVALAGQYEGYDWQVLFLQNVSANAETRLLSEKLGADMYYWELCRDVQTFQCGALDYAGTNSGTTMTVELRLYEAVDGVETGEYVVVGTYEYTF